MQITLPPEAQAIIDCEFQSGRYSSVEEVIIDALFQLNFDPGSTYIPDEYLVTAREQAARGETMPLTDDFFERSMERARENARLGKPVRDEIKY